MIANAAFLAVCLFFVGRIFTTGYRLPEVFAGALFFPAERASEVLDRRRARGS